MAEKTEFKTVETSQEDLEELEEKIRRHRHKIARRTALVIVTVVAAVIFVELWSALRTYSGFEVQASAERTVRQRDIRCSREKYWNMIMTESCVTIQMTG